MYEIVKMIDDKIEDSYVTFTDFYSQTSNLLKMKNIAILFLFLFQTFFAVAQRSRSTLHIHLSDGAPLMVTINERNFKKINTLITIGDLPHKRHSIQVYKYRAYADGKGGKAELLYSGHFKVEPGYNYDCIVDVTSRKLYIKKMTPGQGMYTPPPPPSPPDFRKDVPLSDPAPAGYSSALSGLKRQIEAVKEDTKKLEIAKAYITRNNVYTEEVRQITSWIMFDDNKMELLKAAYPSIQDKEQYASLKDVFTLPATQKEFAAYAKGKR